MKSESVSFYRDSRSVRAWMAAGFRRWRERRQLQRIDLYDISVSRRADIEQEIDKPWWVE